MPENFCMFAGEGWGGGGGGDSNPLALPFISHASDCQLETAETLHNCFFNAKDNI